jgi:hypothetical protein
LAVGQLAVGQLAVGQSDNMELWNFGTLELIHYKKKALPGWQGSLQ